MNEWMVFATVATGILMLISSICGAIMFMWNRHNSIYKTIADLRIEVAKNYVENKTLERVEERLERSITKLGDRLELLLRALVDKGEFNESQSQ